MQSISRWAMLVVLGGLFAPEAWTARLAAEPLAAVPPSRTADGAAGSATIVAHVEGVAITAADVAREHDRLHRRGPEESSTNPALLAEIREHLIERRLAQKRLTALGLAASEADIDLALERLEKQLTAQNIRPADHYQQIGQTRDEVRAALRWQISWQAYLARQLTDENLQKYFAQHAREFDGTRLRISQILWKPTDESDAARQAANDEAKTIRQQIVEGKLTFAAAAREHSTGPSSAAGGDLGWIERRQPMPEAISAAAYALKPGDVSPPVWTPLGLHLVQVTEVQPGQRTWEDARGELRAAVTSYLFRWLADGERRGAKIERNPKWPPRENEN
jgi:parvulin-like peptidyl-prolyl isomerase